MLIVERVKPREAREAREIIRKHNPALAMRLDVSFPVEICDHDWPKGRAVGDSIFWICRGCSETVVCSAGRWITKEVYQATRLRVSKAIKRRMDTEARHNSGWILEKPTYETTWR